jgi:hypothetical protein
MDAIPVLRDGFFCGGRVVLRRANSFRQGGQKNSRSCDRLSTGSHLKIPYPEITITIQALLIIPSISEITARTMRICIRPPTLYTKTPRSQPIRRITAIK